MKLFGIYTLHLLLLVCIISKSVTTTLAIPPFSSIQRKATDSCSFVQLGNDIIGSSAYDKLGSSISLSENGNILAVGIPTDNKVKVYSYDTSSTCPGVWTPMGTIHGENVGDEMGTSVSLSSDGLTIAVGAPLNDGVSFNAGHARVYTYSGTAWVKLGSDLDAESISSYSDYTGFSVSISSNGRKVAVGARYHDASTGDRAGNVKVYSYSGASWTQMGQDIEGEAADDEAATVSISGDGLTVAIGAAENDAGGTSSGHVRVFSYESGSQTWIQIGEDIDGDFLFDYSGTSVSLSEDGSKVAIGAPGSSSPYSGSGLVKVFYFDTFSSATGTWKEVGSDEINGSSSSAKAGQSVSLTNDLSLVYGSPGRNRVKLRKFNGVTWDETETFTLSSGEFGAAVSTSSDATVIAATAPAYSSYKGLVRVYQYQCYDPCIVPTELPTQHPTKSPSKQPTNRPSIKLSQTPTVQPSIASSDQPSILPIFGPSAREPTTNPTGEPSLGPSVLATAFPTKSKSLNPSPSSLDQSNDESGIQTPTPTSVRDFVENEKSTVERQPTSSSSKLYLKCSIWATFISFLLLW